VTQQRWGSTCRTSYILSRKVFGDWSADLPLRRSFRVLRTTVAVQFRPSLFCALVLLHVQGFRLVLARGQPAPYELVGTPRSAGSPRPECHVIVTFCLTSLEL
jgi:hypothetical protein